MIDTTQMFKVNNVYRLKKSSPYFNNNERYGSHYGRHFIVTEIEDGEEGTKTNFVQVHIRFLETEYIDWYYSDFLIHHYESIEEDSSAK